MPGISIQRSSSTRQPSLEARLEPLLYDERYRSQTVFESPDCGIGYTAYPTYPVEVVRIDGYLITFEGYIYDWDHGELRSELRTLFDRSDEFRDRAVISEWLRTTDGEFVLIAVDEGTDEITVIGDCLGRLPLYYAETGDGIAISRAHRFVTEWLYGTNTETAAADGGSDSATTNTRQNTSAESAAQPEFDRLAVAQFLLFGHTLGNRTLVEGVARLPPAPYVRITDDGTTIERLHVFDFDRKARADMSIERNAVDLAALFDRACRRRAAISTQGSAHSDSDRRPLISLSGGLDSRAILASFAEQELPCATATMDYPGVPKSDIDSARELATQYGVEWSYHELPRPEAAVLSKHVRMKDARDQLMPYLLEFFKTLLDEYGSVTCFTGAGGDRVLPDLRPPNRPGDLDDVVDQLIETRQRFSIDDVATLTGVSAAVIRNSIRRRVETYPETDPEQLYVHYHIYDRARNWHFEAEDTNRGYLWSVTPFYSLPFFECAMNCPDSQKRFYRLYSAFLAQLSDRALAPVNPNFGVSPGSPLHTLSTLLFEILQRYPETFEAMKPVLRWATDATIETDSEPAVSECIHRQVDSCQVISDLLSVPAIEQFVLRSDSDEYSRRDAYLLLTLTSYIDELTGGISILEADRELQFGM